MNARIGFTLLEVLVSLASSLLLVAAVTGFSRAQSRMVARELRDLRRREANRRVLEMIAREIRGAGFAPVAGSFDGALDGLAVAARDRIEIRADLHGPAAGSLPDGILDPDSDERIGFFANVVRGNVSESIGRQTLPLTLDSMVSAGGFVLRYLDACGEEIVPATGSALSAEERPRVRSIAIRLTIREGLESVTDEVVGAIRNRRSLRCP